MPARVRLTLKGPKPASPHAHADGLRAVALGAVTRANPDLGDWIHNVNQPKPLSVGPLVGSREAPDTQYVEIGCASDELYPLLVTGLPAVGTSVRLGHDYYVVQDVRMVASASFEELYFAEPPGRVITVRLVTPTAHHAAGSGRRAIVAPDASLYFGSWLGRWSLCSGIALPDGAHSRLTECMVISAFQGGTSAVRLREGRVFVGFCGVVEFTYLPRCDSGGEALRAAWALARLAEYCGTGVETMRGMGWTRLERRRTAVGSRPRGAGDGDAVCG